MQQHVRNCVLVDAQGRVPTDASRRDEVMLQPIQPGSAAYEFAPGRFVQRVPSLERVASTYHRVRNPEVVRAIGYLEYRERTQFHPRNGQPLEFDTTPFAVGRSTDQADVFPRIDPAVIGRITLAGSNKLLVARNALRPDYFSLIAGFIELGETIEQAFAREAMEETGRVVENINYVRSQPWPYGGSLMIGVEATTQHEQPITATDKELAEVRWVSPEEILDGKIALPHRTSIAYAMITEWAQTHLATNTRSSEESKQ